MQIQNLTAEHLDSILDFETVNRAYFAATIPDRGDDFFGDYPPLHAELLAYQDAGTDIFHVLVDDDGRIAGRVNLVHISDGEAELGYRIGRQHAGRGVATDAVRRVCDLARSDYGLTRLRARTTKDNHASRTVLLHNGFTIVGETVLTGGPGDVFVRDLTSGC